jgi:CRP-like cAMP-binding protein
MVDKSELLRVPAFAGLPDDQLDWFLSHSQELHLAAGEIYVHTGDPPDWMFVLLEGQYQWRGEFGGETVVIPGKAGEVTGALPYSRMKTTPVNGRALTEGRALKFPASLFPEMVQRMPELTSRLVGYMSDRIREVTRMEEQRSRLVSLGKLSAGLAHELNNPASAAKRAASQLQHILRKLRDTSLELGKRDLTAAQKSEIEKLETWFTQQDGVPPDALTAADLEDQIDSLLRSHGQNDLWQLAGSLARRNIRPEAL